ncbi:MAG TPA: hypothetical protein VL859_10675 [Flavobacterium sp.]|nr:hypothetical protein [Flavobacterium sp.]
MTLYNQTFARFNQNFIGSATLSILVQSCLGGTAAMSILANGTSILQMIQLAIIVFISIIANTSILAQMTHKFIFNSVLISMLASIFFIVINNL